MTQQHKVRTEMEAITIPIESVAAHPENPRRGDTEAIMYSLERFGQVRPILVQKSTGYVVAGNHTRHAAERLGWTHIAAITVDLTDEEANAYLLADNRLADKGKYEETKLYALLQTQMDLGNLEATAYTIDDLEDLAGQLELGARTEDGGLEPAEHVANPKKRDELATGEPLREIVLLLPASRCVELGIAVEKMKKALGTTSISDTIERVVLTSVRALDASDAERTRGDESAASTTASSDEPPDEPTAATDPNISMQQTPVADGPGELSQIGGVVQPFEEGQKGVQPEPEPDESLEEYRQRMGEPERNAEQRDADEARS